jgi:hypothetical protein
MKPVKKDDVGNIGLLARIQQYPKPKITHWSTLMDTDWYAPEPSTDDLTKVTCHNCQIAIRSTANAYAKARRFKTIDKHWGKS